MTKGKSALVKKKKKMQKGIAPNGYWLMTAQIREEIYYSLISRKWVFKEQKGCHKGARGLYLLYIDQHILKETKKWRKM